MKTLHIIKYSLAGMILLSFTVAEAALIGVNDSISSAGDSAQIISAPGNVLDDMDWGGAENTAMQGFNEAQGVLTSTDYLVDGGVIAAGTMVDSHMVFFNSAKNRVIVHDNVEWTFDGEILGVMSDSRGNYEAASTWELGNSGTTYTAGAGVPSRQAPSYRFRGLEGYDHYSFTGNVLTISLRVKEPGDWIRVITRRSPDPVPEPTTMLLFGTGIAGLAAMGRRKRK